MGYYYGFSILLYRFRICGEMILRKYPSNVLKLQCEKEVTEVLGVRAVPG